MELNHDCVRESLLYLESHVGITAGVNPNDVVKALAPKYGPQETAYVLSKLREAGYIVGGFKFEYDPMGHVIPSETTISDITWQGHEYLDNIRDAKVWKYVKTATKQFSSVSLSIMESVAANYIKSKLGL